MLACRLCFGGFSLPRDLSRGPKIKTDRVIILFGMWALDGALLRYVIEVTLVK